MDLQNRLVVWNKMLCSAKQYRERKYTWGDVSVVQKFCVKMYSCFKEDIYSAQKNEGEGLIIKWCRNTIRCEHVLTHTPCWGLRLPSGWCASSPPGWSSGRDAPGTRRSRWPCRSPEQHDTAHMLNSPRIVKITCNYATYLMLTEHIITRKDETEDVL